MALLLLAGGDWASSSSTTPADADADADGIVVTATTTSQRRKMRRILGAMMDMLMLDACGWGAGRAGRGESINIYYIFMGGNNAAEFRVRFAKTS
jgi:hypothetical protein